MHPDAERLDGEKEREIAREAWDKKAERRGEGAGRAGGREMVVVREQERFGTPADARAVLTSSHKSAETVFSIQAPCPGRGRDRQRTVQTPDHTDKEAEACRHPARRDQTSKHVEFPAPLKQRSGISLIGRLAFHAFNFSSPSDTFPYFFGAKSATKTKDLACHAAWTVRAGEVNGTARSTQPHYPYKEKYAMPSDFTLAKHGSERFLKQKMIIFSRSPHGYLTSSRYFTSAPPERTLDGNLKEKICLPLSADIVDVSDVFNQTF
ncbi:hypothetical protein B0H17DRAFT_1265506 [Mycena rosella]|uniref:Uncharacterized protein n=1 Tax=Mycena rosella TaxID=1033263 RepID=A0AAD7CPW3_MYCRO|nr:hypothetical protein B0H17DRAFT_1265506 [Mycena rosella]